MHKIFNTILLALVIIIVPSASLAAELNFNPSSALPPLPNGFSTTLLINTQGESLNAIEGTVMVAKDLGEDISVSDSASIVTFWVKRPEFDPATHSISFSGTIPGGYSGGNGILFSIISKSYTGEKLSVALTATNLKAFVNDGFGTPAVISGAQYALNSGNSEINSDIQSQLYLDERKIDNVPPESFDPQVSRDDSVYNGAWFLSFATTDKQSGVDHFEVQESRSGEIQSGDWKVASSPYLLQDQTLSSYIFITAIDKQGNERIIKVFPKNGRSFWSVYKNDIYVVFGLIFVLMVVSIVMKRQNKIVMISSQ